MNALVIALHGSRVAAANEALADLALQTATAGDGRWGAVRLGFLQFGDPLLGEALEQLTAEGAVQITVVPLFLGVGRHMQHDVPAAIAGCRAKHPAVEVLLTPHLGAWEGLPNAVTALAIQSEKGDATAGNE